jgi:hypothetical protein
MENMCFVKDSIDSFIKAFIHSLPHLLIFSFMITSAKSIVGSFFVKNICFSKESIDSIIHSFILKYSFVKTFTKFSLRKNAQI